MTEITITTNDKPSYHYATDENLSEAQIAKEISENLYPKAGVEYKIVINQE